MERKNVDSETFEVNSEAAIVECEELVSREPKSARRKCVCYGEMCEI